MREIRQSGSEGGESQLNASSLPLSFEAERRQPSSNLRRSTKGFPIVAQ